MPESPTAQTFTAADAVELASIERNGFLESRHLGSAVLLAANGNVIHELGDIRTPIFARSTLKPLQTIAALRAGAPLEGVSIAMASASHVAEQAHMDQVRSMLAAAGLDEAALQCPPEWPQDEAARSTFAQQGRGKAAIAYNCSGKHAAFLWACVRNDWSTTDYLSFSHPLKRQVESVIEEFTEESIQHWGVDGCGAPLAAVSLYGLANATRKLALAANDLNADARAATVARAMLDYPWAVHGHGKENTIVMEKLGVLAKSGAEGVLILGAEDGTSVAIKILDGNGRAATLIGLALLVATGAVDAQAAGAVLDQVVPKITGGPEEVGRVRLSSAITDLLAKA